MKIGLNSLRKTQSLNVSLVFGLTTLCIFGTPHMEKPFTKATATWAPNMDLGSAVTIGANGANVKNSQV